MPVIPQSVPGIDNKTTHHYVHILQQTGLARMLYSGQRGEITQKSEKVFLANTTFYMRSVTDWDSRNTLKLQQKLTTKGLLCYKKMLYMPCFVTT